MRRTNKREFNFNHPSPQEYDLNKSSVGCAPCLNEVSKIEKGIKNRSLNEIKIDEIKRIINSIFEGKKTSD